MNVQKIWRGIAVPAGAFALLALLLPASCSMGVPHYTLTVLLGEGVTGTPPTGQFSYKELTPINFNYSGVNTLDTVEVMLNDRIRYSSTGTFVLYGDGYKLTANVIDIRGSYKITLTYSDNSTAAPAPFTVTLTGADRLSGTFIDDRGYHGTWTAQSNVVTLSYWDWEFYTLTTTSYNMGHSAGAFAGGGHIGTWVGVKQ